MMNDISELREWANNKIKLYDKMAVEAPHLYASDVSRSMLHRIVDLCDKTAWHYPAEGDYPTDVEKVLCCLWENKIEIGVYSESDKGWYVEGYSFIDEGNIVKAWMPLPLPPKENEK